MQDVLDLRGDTGQRNAGGAVDRDKGSAAQEEASGKEFGIGYGGLSNNLTGLISLSGVVVAVIVAFIMPFVGPPASDITLDDIEKKISELESAADKAGRAPQHMEIGRQTQKGALVALRQAFIVFCHTAGFIGVFGTIAGIIVGIVVLIATREPFVPLLVRLGIIASFFYLGLICGAACMVYLVGLAITIA